MIMLYNIPPIEELFQMNILTKARIFYLLDYIIHQFGISEFIQNYIFEISR